MRSTYLGIEHRTRPAGSHPRVGLTPPSVIEAFVTARIQDPSLLSRRTSRPTPTSSPSPVPDRESVTTCR